MNIENVLIGDIKPYPKNAKEHTDEQVKRICVSINEFGFNQPIVVDKDDVIIVGHGRYMAALQLGLDEVPVFVADLTDEQARAYRLADNKLNESAWDMGLVFEELKALSFEMAEMTGFDPADIEGSVKADEINELAKENQIDLGKYNVMTVEAPEAPRLKARMSFYFTDIEEFERIKLFFKHKGGQLDTVKLSELAKQKDA